MQKEKSHFPNHVQNNVKVSAGRPTSFANMAELMKKVIRLIISGKDINNKTSKVSQNIVIRDCGHQQNS